MALDDPATLIGFVGVALLLLAFVLNLSRVLSANGPLYLGLNVAGAALACYSSYLFMPFVLLEGVWALAALVSMVRIFLSRADTAAH